jgi:hypothetical protein
VGVDVGEVKMEMKRRFCHRSNLRCRVRSVYYLLQGLRGGLPPKRCLIRYFSP